MRMRRFFQLSGQLVLSLCVSMALTVPLSAEAARSKPKAVQAKKKNKAVPQKVQARKLVNKKELLRTRAATRVSASYGARPSSVAPASTVRRSGVAFAAVGASAGAAAGGAWLQAPAGGAVQDARLAGDQLHLSSNAVLVVDQNTHEILLSKNHGAVLPIASLTKLMTGLLVDEARLPMDEVITILDEDVDRLKYSGSRLQVGTRLTRGEAMHLALMSSENRAAHALGRTYPGGLDVFVRRMNELWWQSPPSALCCVSCLHRRLTNWPATVVLCSTATAIASSMIRAGVSACRRPVISARPGAVW